MYLRNAVKTPDGTIIESWNIHHCVIHEDANGKMYGVDGGLDYLRRIGDCQDCEDLSIVDNGDHELRRSTLRWGRYYDIDNVALVEIEHILIKDLTTPHIKAIIDGNYCKKGLYREVLKNELKYRIENKENMKD